MEIDFNNIRKRAISDYNKLTETELDNEQKTILCDLRDIMVILACMYDENDKLFRCIIDEVTIKEVT